MQKKRVLFIQHSLTGGGAEKVLHDILHRFDYSKYSVDLLLIKGQGVYLDKLPQQVRIISIRPFSHGKYIERVLFNRLVNKRPFRRVRDWLLANIAVGFGKKYDCIISFMESTPVYLHSLIMNRSTRNITWVHIDFKQLHYSLKYFPSPKDELKAYKRMDEIVFVSKNARRAFEELYHLSKNNRVIYNLIERELIIKRGSEFTPIHREHKYVISTVGRLSLQKRHDRLIEVIAKLWHEYSLDVEVWIVGTGPKEAELRDLATQLKVDDRVMFMGFQENPYPFIKQSDIFLLTSDTEGLPLVICETLCLGKPIVATNVTGPSELLINDAGILTPLDASKIAERVYHLLTDPAKIQYYSTRAKQRSLIFCPEDTMTEIYSVINNEIALL